MMSGPWDKMRDDANARYFQLLAEAKEKGQSTASAVHFANESAKTIATLEYEACAKGKREEFGAMMKAREQEKP